MTSCGRIAGCGLERGPGGAPEAPPPGAGPLAPARPGGAAPLGADPRGAAHPDGMILAFTLLLLFLISMMGIYVLTTTTTELSITGHNRVGREAFNAADAAARVSLLLGRILLHPELGPPEDVLTTGTGPAFPLEVELNAARFTLSNLQAEAAQFNFAERYRQALSVSADPDERPHLTFKVADKVVATAVMSLESYSPVDPGASLGVLDSYDSGGGSNVRINLVVTVNGVPSTVTQTVDSYEPRSVITTIYREFM